MRTQYEYCLCTVQYGRVSFVNSQWIGAPDQVNDKTSKSLESCPLVWNWLSAAGRDGWELVSVVVTHLEHQGQQMYLRRAVE